MKKQLITRTMSILIIFTAALVSCSKSDTIQPKQPKTDTIPVVKHAASFTSDPALNPDTLFARTPGVLSWTSAHATSTSVNLGTLAESKNSATIPAQETSTSATVTLTGEDGVNISKTVSVPVYDTVISYACNGSKKWKMVSSVRSWAGGSVNLPLDLDLTIYYREIYNGGRKGTTIHNGVEYPNGTWYHLNGGTQYGDGLNIWTNVSISSTSWTRSRTDGVNTWTVVCVTVP